MAPQFLVGRVVRQGRQHLLLSPAAAVFLAGAPAAPVWQGVTLAALVPVLPALLSGCSGAAAKGGRRCAGLFCVPLHLLLPPSTEVCPAGCPSTQMVEVSWAV